MSAEKCPWGCCDYHTEKAEHVEGTFSEDTNEDDVTVLLCDECGEEFEEGDTESAIECCTYWSCNYCGYHTSSQHDAVFCCHTSCYDCGEEGWPDDLEDHECEHDEDSCGCGGCDSNDRSMGTSSTPPWVARGDLEYEHPLAKKARKPEQKWQQVWGFEPKHHDPVRAAGEYYILESIVSGIVGSSHEDADRRRWMSDATSRKVIQMEAEEAMDNLVREFTPVFRAYAHLAIGGELRHHVAIGGHILHSNRSTAWAGWKSIFEAVGPQALLDAADLFREFRGGTYGGEPWAQACDVLYAYETGKISARLFIDRMFSLQHNGGCFLNKVTWGDKNPMGWDVHKLQYGILPAHGAEPEPDYPVLLSVCGGEVQSLFVDYWKVAMIRGVRPTPNKPRWQDYVPYSPAPLKDQAQQAVNQAEYYEKISQDYAKEATSYAAGSNHNKSYLMYAKEYWQSAQDYWAKAVKYTLEEQVNGDPASMTEDQKKAKAIATVSRNWKKKVEAYRNCECWLHGGTIMSNSEGWFNSGHNVIYDPSEEFDPDDPF